MNAFICTPYKRVVYLLAYLFIASFSDASQLKPPPLLANEYWTPHNGSLSKMVLLNLTVNGNFIRINRLARMNSHSATSKEQDFINSPSSWNGHRVNGEVISGDGCITFYLRINGN